MSSLLPTQEYDVHLDNPSDFDPVVKESIGSRTLLYRTPRIIPLDDYIKTYLSESSLYEIDQWILCGIDSGLIRWARRGKYTWDGVPIGNTCSVSETFK
jgi:hypothetical protein